MKHQRTLIALLSAVMMLTLGLYGQNELADFPRGTTSMVYEMRTEEVAAPQYLSLTVTGLEDGRYQLRMTAESTGTPEELSLFGFLFGMTTFRSGRSDVSIDPLAALIARREHLAEGEEYLLPGGGTFATTAVVEIASVRCLQGTYTSPDEPDTRMTLAFSLSEPVFISPLVHVEKKQEGVWVMTFSLELTKYTFTPPGG